MSICILEEGTDVLGEYGEVPIAFRVETRFRAVWTGPGPGGWELVEEPVEVPYLKDYDAIPGEGPASWAERWDLAYWGVLSAYCGAQRVGGAVTAWNTPGLDMLQERSDLAVLWDLRVRPDCRSQGVGRRLFEAAVAWARERDCRELLVETQNINVPACRFYARQGCRLEAVHQLAYPDFPDEIQLLWVRDLEQPP